MTLIALADRHPAPPEYLREEIEEVLRRLEALYARQRDGDRSTYLRERVAGLERLAAWLQGYFPAVTHG